MREIWDRIEQWLKVNAPEVLATLNPGASPQEIEEAEAQLNIKFPGDFVESCLIHNGQSVGITLIPTFYFLLSLSEISDQWNVFKKIADENNFFDGIDADADPAIQPQWWNEKWIPIAQDLGGWVYCIDFAPSSHGCEGQIIEMRHDDAKLSLIAHSFSELLTQYVEALALGKIIAVDGDIIKHETLK